MKFKKNSDKEPISEAEIKEQMNFDKFISSYTPPVKGFLSGTKLFALLGGVLAAAAIVVVLLTKPQNSPAMQAPFVLPPIKAMDAPLSDFTLETSKDSRIVFSTGSIISVPAGAFQDENGNIVAGSVQIHYREFHDPIDIMLSGIPMTYDSAGTRYEFESAGMFEITATKDGKPLRLVPGKELKINMISGNPEPEKFNFYSLDTAGRKWDYEGENTIANNTCIKAYEERVSGNDQTANSQKALAEELEKMKPVMPQKADPKRPNFRIDFKADEFPELAVFSGIKFEPLKGESGYNPGLSKKTWEEVLIKRHKNGKNYVVTFSSGKESHSFTVIPVVEGKDLETALAAFNAKEKQYEEMLAQRLKNSGNRNDSLYRLNAKYKNMAASGDLERRFTSFMDNTYSETSRDLLAYRTFSITKLGVWNCDQPLPFFRQDFASRSGTYKAEFTVESGEEVVLTNVYFIRRELNSIFSVKPENFSRFPFVKEDVDVMVGITDDNQLLYLKDDDLRASAVNGKSILFRMKKTPDEIVKAEQLKKFLKL